MVGAPVRLSTAAARRLLLLLATRRNVLAPWDHAGLLELQGRGHAGAEAVYQQNGRLCASKLWRITEVGSAWLEAHP